MADLAEERAGRAPYLLAPLERLVIRLAARVQIAPSGRLTIHLSLTGAFLLVILFVAHLQRA